MSTQNLNPVSQLLALGEAEARATHHPETWREYAKLGIDRSHVPDLIAILTDESLLATDGPEVMAPVHAWRILAELQAVEALPSLVSLLNEIDENNDDWVASELPKVFNKIGGAALDVLEPFAVDVRNGPFARVCAFRSISEIGGNHPELRARCVEGVTSMLRTYQANEKFFNASLISDLVDLKAVESLDLIREAYAKDRVDFDVLGDFEDAEIGFGLRTHRTTPRKLGPIGQQFARLLEAKEKAQPIVAGPKVGRNDPCPCGSGRKYKKCHGSAGTLHSTGC